MSDEWVKACMTGDVDREDVIPVHVGNHHLAVYQSPDGEYFATDGFCTHERFPLTAGYVMGSTIECAKHNGTFNYKTGQGLEAPICVDLKTYPVRVEQGVVFVKLN